MNGTKVIVPLDKLIGFSAEPTASRSQNSWEASRDLNQTGCIQCASGDTFGMQPFCCFPWRRVRSIPPFGILTLGSYWSG
jgi:hypothetical protein